jgi:hypothetical protein
MARKRKASAIGYLVRAGAPLVEERRGLTVSTFGKVIKSGWDWLGVTPAASDRIGGLIEAPALAECLTLNKGDFVRSGPRGALYLAYRKAIQEGVSAQLAQWGDAPAEADRSRRRAARPVERDLETVLVDLADDFPLLASLVERRSGGATHPAGRRARRLGTRGERGAQPDRHVRRAACAGLRGQPGGGRAGTLRLRRRAERRRRDACGPGATRHGRARFERHWPRASTGTVRPEHSVLGAAGGCRAGPAH